MTAYARASHPLTAHEAAASITDSGQRGAQQAALSVLRLYGPLTVDEIVYVVGTERWKESRLRTACTELERAGLAYRLNENGRSARGRRCTIWAASARTE